MLLNCGSGKDSWESLEHQGNQPKLKGNQLCIFIGRTGAEVEAPILWPPDGKTHWKRSWCWERLRAGGERVTEDEMVGCHHWLNGYEFEQTLGDSKGQGSLMCCSPWRSQRVKHNLATEQQQWLKKHIISPINLSLSYKRLTTVPQTQASSPVCSYKWGVHF